MTQYICYLQPSEAVHPQQPTDIRQLTK